MDYNAYTYTEDALVGGFFLLFIAIALIIALIGYVVNAFIYYTASKTNGFEDVAYIAWIPLANMYCLFLLTAEGKTRSEQNAIAKRNILIYVGLFIATWIPLIGIIASLGLAGFTLYYIYRLFYRWSGSSGKSILYVVLTFITSGLFYAIYGLMRMKRPFIA
ncbi:hypothetical protein [Lysinibacillus piscis]|uniref:Tripartite tricarboxylate transporter TctB family protein n=1 Tax=Lysinibacillus piscis TaxID=2518931 RepID=A0ABQ5NFV0_9BACI|nr:hypothetical protein [Lysinibacillus sp. KH24]GLC86929.1 hypothetical protein LYSBPC_00560 [Lysinibacillus sp. KH24]